MSTDDEVPPTDDPRTRAAADARARLRGAPERAAENPPGDTPAPLAEPAAGPPSATAPPTADPVALVDEPAADPVTAPHPVLAFARRAWLVPAALGTLCVALAVALALTLVSLHDADSKASARASALAAAKAYAVDLSSYRYQDLAADFDRVLAHATPSFKKSYSNSSDGLDTILKRYKASATGKVLAAGISSATSSRAVVLVFVNQTVTNTQQKKPTTDESRILITLVRHGGTWLIDKVSLE